MRALSLQRSDEEYLVIEGYFNCEAKFRRGHAADPDSSMLKHKRVVFIVFNQDVLVS